MRPDGQEAVAAVAGRDHLGATRTVDAAGGELRMSLPTGFVDAIADAVAAKLARQLHVVDGSSPWLTAAGAASYLGCSVSRIRTLTLTGDLPHHHDGSRPLYHRDELDAYVRAGGARCP